MTRFLLIMTLLAVVWMIDAMRRRQALEAGLVFWLVLILGVLTLASLFIASL